MTARLFGVQVTEWIVPCHLLRPEHALIKGSDRAQELVAALHWHDKTAVILPQHWACLGTHSLLLRTAHGRAVGVCDTCRRRIMSFKVAGFIDPIDYASHDWGTQ